MTTPETPSPALQRTSDPQALRWLRELGFTSYEALVWISMCQAHPATAYALAKRLKLPRPNVYAACEQLVASGAAKQVSDKPMAYVPTDPRQLFSTLTAENARRCNLLAQEFTFRMQPSPKGLLWSTSGLDEVSRALEQEIDATVNHLWIKGTVSAIERLKAPLLRAQTRGVSIKLIVFGDARRLPKSLKRCEVILHEGDGAPLSRATDALLTLTSDSKAAAVAVLAGTASLTVLRDHALVYVLQSFLLHEIFLGEIAATLGVQPLAGMLAALRQKHRPSGMEATVIPMSAAAP